MIEKIEDKNPVHKGNLTDHLANERTFLAWIRTCIGIMAFGFVVEKFALFMKQIVYFFGKQGLPESAHLPTIQQGYSSVFGILLVGLGALLGLFSFIKYKNIEKQIDNDTYRSSLTLAVALTTLVLVIGIFLVVYLINT